MQPRIAVVTGTSSGFGLYTVVELARTGYRVFATMRDLERAGPLRRALDAAGVVAELVPLDVVDEASVVEAIAHVEHVAGRIDVLVNNAGIIVTGFGEDVAEDELRRQF